MGGEASVTKIIEAATAKADEAEAIKADERTALVDTGMMAAEAASTSPRMEDQPRGHVGERKVHTISSHKPPGHMERR
jgi:hypothetical protein